MSRISRAVLAPFAFGLLFFGSTQPAFAQGGSALANPGDPGRAEPRAEPEAEPEPAAGAEAEPAAEPEPAAEAAPATEPEAGDELPTPPGAEVEPDEFDDPSDHDSGTEPGARMRMLVVDAATFGIDPVVGRVASATMRETGTALGYQVLTQPETIAAAQQLQMPFPPTPADLWRVSWVARVHRGVFARIWAHAGQYVIEVSVASLDGSGPFFARGTAGADDLREVVSQLLRTALPAPSVWSEEQDSTQAEQAAAIDELDDADEASPPAPEEQPEPEPEPELRRWSLTLQTESAFGVGSEFFYNHLLGVRLDFRITRDILFGAYFAYANLNSRNGRADNLLFMLQFEDRIRLSSGLDLTIPLRAAIGYVPFNGPVIRLAAGLNYAVSSDFEIGVDLIAPTFWILADGGTAVTLDVSVEATVRF